MGVKTDLILKDSNLLFEDFTFEKIEPTKDGISDTTYLAFKNENTYIIKHYEDATLLEINEEKKLLNYLTRCKLRVPSTLSVNKSNEKWRLFSCINGKSIKRTSYSHIAQIAKFLSKMHSCTKDKSSVKKLFKKDDIIKELNIVAGKNIKMYYKFKEILKLLNNKNDGIIHGDLFTDNAKFTNNRLSGVYDFIEAGEGSFILDVGVTALSFAFSSLSQKKYFLRCYNSSSRKKIKYIELENAIKFASLFYAMKRFNSNKLNYKELL